MKYQEVVDQYYLDFMRGDMLYVQMWVEGVFLVVDFYYDIYRYIKICI